jgi:hypothetical protein
MTGEPKDSSQDWLRQELDALSPVEFSSSYSAPTQVLLDLYQMAPEIPFSKIADFRSLDICIGDIPYALTLVGSTPQGLVFEIMDEDIEIERIVILNSLYFGRTLDEIPDEVRDAAMSLDSSTVAFGGFAAHDDSDYPFVASKHGICKDSYLVMQKVSSLDDLEQALDDGEEDNIPVAITRLTHFSGHQETVAVNLHRTITLDPITWAGVNIPGKGLLKIGTKPTSLGSD